MEWLVKAEEKDSSAWRQWVVEGKSVLSQKSWFPL